MALLVLFFTVQICRPSYDLAASVAARHLLNRPAPVVHRAVDRLEVLRIFLVHRRTCFFRLGIDVPAVLLERSDGDAVAIGVTLKMRVGIYAEGLAGHIVAAGERLRLDRDRIPDRAGRLPRLLRAARRAAARPVTCPRSSAQPRSFARTRSSMRATSSARASRRATASSYARRTASATT